MSVPLQQPVLVLNRLWQAVNTCSAQRALALLFTGHAQVVHEDESGFNTFSFQEWRSYSGPSSSNEVVRTISFGIRLPRIILLHFFDRLPKKEVKFTRNNVFERDHHTCQYCHKKMDRKHLNIDHVLPRQKGGKTVWTNVVCSCIGCNRHKANRTPEEAGMHLLKPPKKPHWRPFLEVSFTKDPHHSWRHFLDLAHWEVKLG